MVRRLVVAQRGELAHQLVDARVRERGGSRGEVIAGTDERPGEILRCDDAGRQPALDFVETLGQRLLGLALGCQFLDAMGDVLDPVGGRDRLRERGDLIARRCKALAELVEPPRCARFLLGREPLPDVAERRGEALDLVLEPFEAGGECLDLVGIRLGREPLRELGLDPGEPLVELGIADGSRLELDDRLSQLGERPRLLVESRRRSGVLGQQSQPLLERDQRVVQRDDLVRRDDVLDPGSESAQPAFDLDRVGDRAIRDFRNALLDHAQ